MSAVKPVIIISADWREEAGGAIELGNWYVSAVIQAGGIPLAAPPSEDFDDFESAASDILSAGSALLLSGGPDVDPCFFGQGPHRRLGRVNPVRDQLEMALARHALKRGIPVLGICRGMQLLNVAAGGGLVQDIQSSMPKALCHFVQAPRAYPTHWVTVVPGSMLHRILGHDRIRVNSFHHQACSPLAPGFVQAARADDGVVEAIELQPGQGPSHFALGVQWHPECMFRKFPLFLRLFEALVKAAQGGMP